MKSVVDLSHQFLLPALHKQAICIDATLGNGKDTKFFLNNKVHTVYAFEIQEEVYQKTIQALDLKRVKAYCMGHERMDEVVDKEVDAIVFNFGYCPGFDPSITTKVDTSMIAVQKALSLLKKKGRLVLVFYPHEEGMREALEIEQYLQTLDGYAILKVQTFKKNSPFFIGIERE